MFALSNNQVAFIKCSFLVIRGTPRFFTPFPIFLHLCRSDFEYREILRFVTGRDTIAVGLSRSWGTFAKFIVMKRERTFLGGMNDKFRLYEKPEDGQNRSKHLVFIHCTYSTIN